MLVSTVTASSFSGPFSSQAARIIDSLPCTVANSTPRFDSWRTAAATVAGMSKNLRSEKPFLPRWPSASISSK